MACNLFFVAEPDLALIFVTGPRSRHSLNLSHNPAAAVTIHRLTWSHVEISGVQMEGRVQRLPAGSLRKAALELYIGKFRFVEKEFADDVSRSELCRFRPNWMRLIDNSVRFGYQEEFRSAAAGDPS